MKKLQFKTNSRHISQLGRELVTDFVTALVELIKNSYDADAYGVKIILDKPNTPQSRIVLIDTGTGMTQSDFENKWMVIGTNNKITEPYTPKGRKKAGKKGIGRFSVERLAEKVQIYSFPEFEPPYRVDINWNSFEEINIPALTQSIGILKDIKNLQLQNSFVISLSILWLLIRFFKKIKILWNRYLEQKVLNTLCFIKTKHSGCLKIKSYR